MTLRAPIEGKVTIPAQAKDAGATIDAGMKLLNIENPRADRAQLDALRRQISGLQSERDALTRRKAQLQGLQGKLREQRDAFQTGRVAQLEARVAELTAEIAAATAKREETESALSRATRLKANGWQTDAALDKAERDHKVAVNMAESLRQKLTGTKMSSTPRGGACLSGTATTTFRAPPSGSTRLRSRLSSSTARSTRRRFASRSSSRS